MDLEAIDEDCSRIFKKDCEYICENAKSISLIYVLHIGLFSSHECVLQPLLYCPRDKIQGNNPACVIHTLIFGGDIQVMSKFAVYKYKRGQ